MQESIGLDRPAKYRIEVRGRLNESWSDWFGGMTIGVERTSDGSAVSVMTGVIHDQAALHGLLRRIQDLGLPLIRVERMADEPE